MKIERSPYDMFLVSDDGQRVSLCEYLEKLAVATNVSIFVEPEVAPPVEPEPEPQPEQPFAPEGE